MAHDIDVHVIETSTLGDRSYLATDGTNAIVVDPQRDTDRVLLLAGRLGVQIRWVLETHIHNDYVTGGLLLAQLTGARYGVSADDAVSFERVRIRGGDELSVSESMVIRVVTTPGHTFHHLSYVLEGRAGAGPTTLGVFTGGSLLFGTTGRTDLLGEESTETLARAQHGSARRLADLVPDGAAIWPTHGFGSFCSATSGAGGDASTMGDERRQNPALTLAEDAFVRETLAGLDAWPAYYVHMYEANTTVAPPIDLTPLGQATPDELHRRVSAGEWVVDLRHRKAYSSAHLVGTISLGLDGAMVTWLGWLADYGAPITLLGETEADVAAAQRELVRIGIDRPAAAATGTPEEWAGEVGEVAPMPVADFRTLAAVRSGAAGARTDLPSPDVVLDTRLRNEWRDGHVEGSVHVPLYELTARLPTLPPGSVWVYCESGYRATAAAGLVARTGRRAVVIDDDFSEAAEAGLPIATGD